MSEAGAAPAASAGGQGGAPAAGAAPAAGNPAAGSATPPAAGTATSTAWTDSFSDNELKGYAQNKGWKDPSEAVNSYRQFEKLMGAPQDRVIKLPEKADDPAWQDINYKLGVPKDPKDYQIEVPAEYGDPQFAEKARDWFHKLGIPKEKGNQLAKNWNEYIGAQIQAGKDAEKQMLVKETGELRKEWGAAFDQNAELGRRAAHAFGFDEKKINAVEKALGFAGTMKLFHQLHTKIGEDGFVNGDRNNNNFGGLMTPAQAQAQIKLRQKDLDFRDRLLKKDTAALTEWNELHKMAHPQLD